MVKSDVLSWNYLQFILKGSSIGQTSSHWKYPQYVLRWHMHIAINHLLNWRVNASSYLWPPVNWVNSGLYVKLQSWLKHRPDPRKKWLGEMANHDHLGLSTWQIMAKLWYSKLSFWHSAPRFGESWTVKYYIGLLMQKDELWNHYNVKDVTIIFYFKTYIHIFVWVRRRG